MGTTVQSSAIRTATRTSSTSPVSLPHIITTPAATRTILRLIWFLTLLTHLIKNIRAYPEELMSEIARKSYDDSICAFHPPVLREAIRATFVTIPARMDFSKSAFGTTDNKKFTEIVTVILKPLAIFVARLWKYYKDKGITTIE